MKTSVIIPYYNPSGDQELNNLLVRAIRSASDNLESVCDHEILVVNDGSPSAPVLDSVHDISAVRYIYRSHGMLGAARNTGILNATGSIITFLDADDCFFPGALAPCIRKMEESGADLLGFGIERIMAGKTIPAFSSNAPVFDAPVTGEEYMRTHNLFGSSCRYLISSKFIESNGLRFMENAFIEDEEFTTRMMFLSQRYIDTRFPVYAYCIRKGSIITDLSSTKTNAKSADTIKALSSLVNFRAQHQSEPHQGLDRKINWLALDHLRRTLRRKDWKDAIPVQTKALKSLGLFPLPSRDRSFKFRLFSRLSGCKAGLYLLHFAEKKLL